MGCKFKAGDEVVRIDDSEHQRIVVRVKAHTYVVTSDLTNNDTWEVYISTFDEHFRKLTKLDKALK